MKNQSILALFCSAAFCSLTFAQSPINNFLSDAAAAASAPVAYVYVSRTVSGGTEYEIEAFSTSADGKLTPVSGSPFQEDVKSLAVNGKFLFATNHYGTKIETFRLEPNGALRYATTTQTTSQSQNHTLGPMFLDRTGTWLYDAESNVGAYGNYAYQSFAVDKPIGDLKNVGDSEVNSWLDLPAAFTGSNRYAYSASCLQNMYWGIFGFRRSNSGVLKDINPQAAPPAASNGLFYCPSQTATDAANHVAISMQAINQSDFTASGAARLAVYSANSSGILTTASSDSNMPSVSVGGIEDLKMAPSGKLLAVAGKSGLQVFHFNGANPIKHYTGLLTKYDISQCFWDNQNHLYAISNKAGKLYVFNVTPTAYSAAPGSPYAINKPQAIVALPGTIQ